MSNCATLKSGEHLDVEGPPGEHRLKRLCASSSKSHSGAASTSGSSSPLLEKSVNINHGGTILLRWAVGGGGVMLTTCTIPEKCNARATSGAASTKKAAKGRIEVPLESSTHVERLQSAGKDRQGRTFAGGLNCKSPKRAPTKRMINSYTYNMMDKSNTRDSGRSNCLQNS